MLSSPGALGIQRSGSRAPCRSMLAARTADSSVQSSSSSSDVNKERFHAVTGWPSRAQQVIGLRSSHIAVETLNLIFALWFSKIPTIK